MNAHRGALPLATSSSSEHGGDSEGADLLLFVAGEPDPGGASAEDFPTSLIGRLAGAVIGLRWVNARGSSPVVAEPPPTSAEAVPWHLPAPQVLCVNLVSEVADGLARRVALIDVNRPAGREELIERWVGPTDVLPLLVRPDGLRLDGMESFTKKRLRRFIGLPSRGQEYRGRPLRSG
jgi:hypothetical protein